MATTTPSAIRDRAKDVIAALTPTSHTGDEFRASQNVGDFRAECETNPGGCRRRFQVRTTGATETPPVSNHDVEEHRCTLTVEVAYPKDGRDGRAWSLDRDDTIDEDAFQIDKAIGMLGAANFTSPYADATWIEGSVPEREDGEGVVFLVLRYVYKYERTR